MPVVLPPPEIVVEAAPVDVVVGLCVVIGAEVTEVDNVVETAVVVDTVPG